MTTLAGWIHDRVSRLPGGTSVSLLSTTGNYFSVVTSCIEAMAQGMDTVGVYICATRPAATLHARFAQSKNVPLHDIFFVDCISYMVGGGNKLEENCSYVESPTMLETIMLKAEYQLRLLRDRPRFVFFDSINTLAIYNDEKLMSEFLHTFVNSLRLKEVYSVLLSIPDQTPDAVANMLQLVCDDQLDTTKGG